MPKTWDETIAELRLMLDGYDKNELCSLQIVDAIEHAGASLRGMLEPPKARVPHCHFCGGTGTTYAPRAQPCSVCKGRRAVAHG